MLTAVAALGMPFVASAEELPSIAVIGKPIPARLGGGSWPHRVEFLFWGSDDSIAYGGTAGFVCNYDLKLHRQAWEATVGTAITGVTGSSDSDRLYVLDAQGTIHILAKSDDKELSSTALGRGQVHSGATPYSGTFVWNPQRQCLLFSGVSGDVTLTAERLNIVAVKSEDGFHDVSLDPTGQYVVLTSNLNTVRIWDLKQKKLHATFGKPEESLIDAQFVSNGWFDGTRTLIITNDNAWSVGSVTVADTIDDEFKVVFSSENGHVVIDVDAANKWIALIGTSGTLTVTDFSGTILGQRKATQDRNMVVRFSPNGKRVAIGSLDNTVRIFDLSGLNPAD